MVMSREFYRIVRDLLSESPLGSVRFLYNEAVRSYAPLRKTLKTRVRHESQRKRSRLAYCWFTVLLEHSGDNQV